jgi:hypothetical protein
LSTSPPSSLEELCFPTLKAPSLSTVEGSVLSVNVKQMRLNQEAAEGGLISKMYLYSLLLSQRNEINSPATTAASLQVKCWSLVRKLLHDMKKATKQN